MRPAIDREQPLLGALMELSTERPQGMGVGSIPLSKVWQYLDRFGLPDWWEPVLLQADAALVAAINGEVEGGSSKKHLLQGGKQK